MSSMVFDDEDAGLSLRATPIIRSGGDTIARYDHALVAVSLFNSYYSPRRLESLILWASRAVSSSHLPIFDLPHAFTLAAQRGSTEGVVRRVLEEGRKLRNRVAKIHARHAIDAGKHGILAWSDLAGNRDYLTIRIEVERAYLDDRRLRDSCLDMAGALVSGWEGQAAGHETARLLAVRYLLDELPLLIDSPRILGGRTSAFLYHRAPPLMTDLFSHRFTLRPSEFQGYFVMEDEVAHDPARPSTELEYEPA
jgi:cyclo(L-tyrosyl-L-tyrosyl) synthase